MSAGMRAHARGHGGSAGSAWVRYTSHALAASENATRCGYSPSVVTHSVRRASCGPAAPGGAYTWHLAPFWMMTTERSCGRASAAHWRFPNVRISPAVLRWKKLNDDRSRLDASSCAHASATPCAFGTAATRNTKMPYTIISHSLLFLF